MPKQTKPKCGKGQSCGYACIEITDTCREKISDEDAAKLTGVIDMLPQLKSKSVESFSDSDKGKTFDELAAKYVFTNDIGHETNKLGSATIHSFTLPASDGSGDTLVYSAVLAGGKGYTVSDGTIKEFTASDRQGLYKEALAAALRAKVEADLAKPLQLPYPLAPPQTQLLPLPLPPAPAPDVDTVIDTKLDRSKVPFSRMAVDLESAGADLPKWTDVESTAKSIPVVTALLENTGLSSDEAYKSAVSLKSWLGAGYGNMSKLTYLSDEETDRPENAELRGVLGMAVRALKALPPVTMTELEDSHSNIPSAKGSSKPKAGKPLNRWIKLTPNDTYELVSKYKKGETIEENGMFGTTHLPAEQMPLFSNGASVQYVVSPKLDGTGGGRAVDKYKNSIYEGEVLYVPGTKFKVDKVVYESRDVAKFSAPDKISTFTELLDESSLTSKAGLARRKQLWEDLGEKPYQHVNGGRTVYYSDKDIDDIVAKVGKGTKADANKLLQAAGLPTSLIIAASTGVQALYYKADSRIAPSPNAKIYLTEQ